MVLCYASTIDASSEPPPFRTFGSDAVTISKTDVNGTGLIFLNASDMPRATSTCNGAPSGAVVVSEPVLRPQSTIAE